MAVLTKTQKLKEEKARLERRRASRADRKARKNAAAAMDVPELDPKALGVPVKTVAGHVKQARMNLVEAFELIGGVAQLVKWGKDNLTEFYRLWARLIPKEAAEEQQSNLEQMLAMLAARRGEGPIGEAAYVLGPDTMRKGQAEADAEDAAALFAESQGTMQ